MMRNGKKIPRLGIEIFLDNGFACLCKITFLSVNCSYDDMNTQKLRRAAEESGIETEIEMFNFDARTIVWEDYFMNTHIPGIVKRVFKK